MMMENMLLEELEYWCIIEVMDQWSIIIIKTTFFFSFLFFFKNFE